MNGSSLGEGIKNGGEGSGEGWRKGGDSRLGSYWRGLKRGGERRADVDGVWAGEGRLGLIGLEVEVGLGRGLVRRLRSALEEGNMMPRSFR